MTSEQHGPSLQIPKCLDGIPVVDVSGRRMISFEAVVFAVYSMEKGLTGKIETLEGLVLDLRGELYLAREAIAFVLKQHRKEADLSEAMQDLFDVSIRRMP